MYLEKLSPDSAQGMFQVQVLDSLLHKDTNTQSEVIEKA